VPSISGLAHSPINNSGHFQLADTGTLYNPAMVNETRKEVPEPTSKKTKSEELDESWEKWFSQYIPKPTGTEQPTLKASPTISNPLKRKKKYRVSREPSLPTIFELFESDDDFDPFTLGPISLGTPKAQVAVTKSPSKSTSKNTKEISAPTTSTSTSFSTPETTTTQMTSSMKLVMQIDLLRDQLQLTTRNMAIILNEGILALCIIRELKACPGKFN
jgi:hypothetical protein